MFDEWINDAAARLAMAAKFKSEYLTVVRQSLPGPATDYQRSATACGTRKTVNVGYAVYKSRCLDRHNIKASHF